MNFRDNPPFYDTPAGSAPAYDFHSYSEHPIVAEARAWEAQKKRSAAHFEAQKKA